MVHSLYLVFGIVIFHFSKYTSNIFFSVSHLIIVWLNRSNSVWFRCTKLYFIIVIIKITPHVYLKLRVTWLYIPSGRSEHPAYSTGRHDSSLVTEICALVAMSASMKVVMSLYIHFTMAALFADRTIGQIEIVFFLVINHQKNKTSPCKKTRKSSFDKMYA